MPAKTHQDLVPSRARSRCPVCGEISYSRAGIHPQCSVRQADLEQKKRLKLQQALPSNQQAVKPPNVLSPWQRTCPNCGVVQHVRKTACSCGYTFAVRSGPSQSGGDGA